MDRKDHDQSTPSILGFHSDESLFWLLNVGDGEFEGTSVGSGPLFWRGGFTFGLFPTYGQALALSRGDELAYEATLPTLEQLEELLGSRMLYIEDLEQLEELDYFVADFDQAKAERWSLEDHPALVYEFARPTEAAGALDDLNLMLRFLNQYGPLSASFLRRDHDPYDDMNWNTYDYRNRELAYRYSPIVERVRFLLSEAEKDRSRATLECVVALDSAPNPSLYRGLLLQLLNDLVGGKVARRCKGCDRWFTEPETDDGTRASRARRSDAQYHSRRCLKAASERSRRARIKAAREAA